MTSSLVGSEMCIRDRGSGVRQRPGVGGRWPRKVGGRTPLCVAISPQLSSCLLYTSDAADDM
eukprot:11990900-Prorocentrum_lima.AAC.1